MPSNAYEAVCKEAREIIAACEDALRARIRDGEITDEESLSDAIHEEADSACIYTNAQYVLVFGLRDEEDAIEEGLCSPSNFGEALAAQAYCNVRAALNAIDFSDAFEVAEDSALETEGA
jgi:hypothetical protein